MRGSQEDGREEKKRRRARGIVGLRERGGKEGERSIILSPFPLGTPRDKVCARSEKRA